MNSDCLGFLNNLQNWPYPGNKPLKGSKTVKQSTRLRLRSATEIETQRHREVFPTRRRIPKLSGEDREGNTIVSSRWYTSQHLAIDRLSGTFSCNLMSQYKYIVMRTNLGLVIFNVTTPQPDAKNALSYKKRPTQTAQMESNTQSSETTSTLVSWLCIKELLFWVKNKTRWFLANRNTIRGSEVTTYGDIRLTPNFGLYREFPWHFGSWLNAADHMCQFPGALRITCWFQTPTSSRRTHEIFEGWHDSERIARIG